MDYTDVFGSGTVPSAYQAYNSYSITTNTTFQWPFNYSGTGSVLSSILDISTSAGLTLTLPAANETSKGESSLIRNVGSNSFDLVDSASGAVTTIASGTAKFIWITNNSTAAGTWAVVTFGVGSSTVDAASLVGYGIKAVSTTLNQSHPVVTSATGIAIVATHRAKTVVHTGGAVTYSFSAVATLGDDFFVLFRNEGTGTVTLDPNASETIDSATTISVQPGESLIVVCSGTVLYTVGLGRSVQYNFTQLTKDISAGGTITLTPTEASNKLLTFTGSPAADVIIVVPAVVAVYYVYNNLTTAKQVTIKTSGGTGSAVTQTNRVIVFCDGTNVVSATSIASSTSTTLVSGSAAAPSLNFASKTNTGLFLDSTQDLGITINGTKVAAFTASGITGLTLVTPVLGTPASGLLTSCTMIAINDQIGTTYTLVLTDLNKYVRLSNALAITMTVPANADVAFAVGTQVHLRQVGAGQVTVTEGSGVTVATSETLKLRAQGSSATLIKTGTNTWDLMGDLEAAP